MNVLYVVHPQQRGVQGYSVPPHMAAPLFRHTVPHPVRMFRAQEPTLGEELEHATVEVCRVEPGVVCPHGWFCTTDLRTAQFVDELRGERAAVVAYLRDCAHRDAYRNHNHNRAEALWDAANIVESGEHRREEEP